MFKKDIDDIIFSVFPLNPFVPHEIALSINDRVSFPIRKQLEKLYEKYGKQIEKENLIEIISKYYRASAVPFGESIGVISGQSVGEKQTQSNLNTFHKAGSGERQPVTSRFMEIMNATTNPKAPSFTVYFKQTFTTVKALRETIGNSMVEITLSKITENITVCIGKSPEPWFDTFFSLFSKKGKPEYFRDCLDITIDMNMLYTWNISLYEVYEKLSNLYEDMYIMFSPDVFRRLLIFVDTRSIDYPDGEERKGNEFFSETAVECYLDDVVKKTLRNITLFGITGINEIFYLKEKNYWYIETNNSTTKDETIKTKKRKLKVIDSVNRFRKLLGNSLVDSTKTISSNIWDIYHTLGIEAVRAFMIDSFEQMSQVNRCHVQVLADKMTFDGNISSISRYSMRKGSDGPISRSTFEESYENIITAAIRGETDNLKSIGASIVLGIVPKIGTGISDIEYDMDL